MSYKNKEKEKEKKKEYSKKYYEKSEKGIETRARYENSPQRKAYRKKIRQTQKNKLYMKEYLKKYRNKEKNKIHLRKYMREYFRKYSKKPKFIYSRYQQNAKKRNYKFDLTFEQFMIFWNKDCSYCGDEIETIGLDRIDNNKGYFIGNICPCCSKCNTMKLVLSKNDFINHCKKIAKFNKE